MKSLGMKAAIVCATTVISMTMFATIAFAAPTLDYGQTSGGPHDSRGNCASCHSFEAGPATNPGTEPAAPVATPAAPTVDEIVASLPPMPTGTGTSVGSPYIIIVMNPTYANPSTATQPTVASPTQPTSTQSDSGDDEGDDEGDDD